MTGRWSAQQEQTRHYAMARNLAVELRAQYDRALADVDLLVMPTVPMVAPEIPAADDPLEVRVARALEMVVNTAPFDVSGHPAISVPAGLSDGLPVGMMLVGKRFADATCLRVADAFEQLVGGFPAPPPRR
jgi:amidase